MIQKFLARFRKTAPVVAPATVVQTEIEAALRHYMETCL